MTRLQVVDDAGGARLATTDDVVAWLAEWNPELHHLVKDRHRVVALATVATILRMPAEATWDEICVELRRPVDGPSVSSGPVPEIEATLLETRTYALLPSAEPGRMYAGVNWLAQQLGADPDKIERALDSLQRDGLADLTANGWRRTAADAAPLLERLEVERAQLGLTWWKLAEAIGVTRPELSRLKNGHPLQSPVATIERCERWLSRQHTERWLGGEGFTGPQEPEAGELQERIDQLTAERDELQKQLQDADDWLNFHGYVPRADDTLHSRLERLLASATESATRLRQAVDDLNRIDGSLSRHGVDRRHGDTVHDRLERLAARLTDPDPATAGGHLRALRAAIDGFVPDQGRGIPYLTRLGILAERAEGTQPDAQPGPPPGARAIFHRLRGWHDNDPDYLALIDALADMLHLFAPESP